MPLNVEKIRYQLAPGCQVREEDFGLLFYTRQGPGLFFVASGNLLQEEFFQGRETLEDRYRQWGKKDPSTAARWLAVNKALKSLEEKGVIVAG